MIIRTFHFLSGFLFCAILIVSVLAYLTSTYGETVYHEWTVFPFPPTCQEYEDPETDDDFDFYRPISGEPTEEFWRYAVAELRTYDDYQDGRWRSIAVKNGKIVIALREYGKFRWPLREFEKHLDPDITFFAITRVAARKIYDHRRADDSITDDKLEPFRVHRWRSNMHELPHPDECGFIGELIMKGGQFASE